LDRGPTYHSNIITLDSVTPDPADVGLNLSNKGYVLQCKLFQINNIDLKETCILSYRLFNDEPSLRKLTVI
jgi:hypothetical protein